MTGDNGKSSLEPLQHPCGIYILVPYIEVYALPISPLTMFYVYMVHLGIHRQQSNLNVHC